MRAIADTKYAEALAHEIAAHLARSPEVACVTVELDPGAGTYVVRAARDGKVYELAMPAPGAHYALFSGGAWYGGMNLTSAAKPEEVAATMAARIASAR